jgi:hypothetical protein
MERTKHNKTKLVPGILQSVTLNPKPLVVVPSKEDIEVIEKVIAKHNMTRVRTCIGIDNGVSGAITILWPDGEILLHIKTPIKNCLNYTKKKAFANRIDFPKMKTALSQAGENTMCYIERPMVNPTRFKASVSAIRCLEATEILLEELQIPYQFIDSKEWQKELLPSKLVGIELKKAADSVAHRLYPKAKIVNSDSLLIAVHCLRKTK